MGPIIWKSHGHQSKVPLVFYIYSQRINTKPNGKLKWSEDRKRDIFFQNGTKAVTEELFWYQKSL